MDFSQILKPGMAREQSFEVREEHSAAHVGSGSVGVLATPWMIAFMEVTARTMLDEALPQGYSSVGVRVDVRHLAPTPVGSTLRARAEISEVGGERVGLSVEAWDERERVGAGRHERVVIEVARFLKRVEKKAGAE